MDPIGLIGIGANLLGGLMGNDAQTNANRENIRFQIQMYERQRKDALSDWNMQNEYNSPAMQMKRFKDAGLNPNLIYGQGSPGLSQPVRSAGTGTPSFKAPTALPEALTSSLMMFQDAQIKQQQYDNLKKQYDLLDTENLVKLATLPKLMAETGNKEFDLQMKQLLQQNSLEVAEQKLRNMQFELSSGQIKLRAYLDRNESEIAKNSQSISESMERILNYRIGRAKTTQEIENLKAMKEYTEMGTESRQWDIMLKQYEKKMNDMGITKNSPAYLTILGNLFDMLSKKADDLKTDYTDPKTMENLKSHF